MRFEPFTTAIWNAAIFQDIPPCISCLNRRFRRKYHLHFQRRKSAEQEASLQPLAAQSIGSHMKHTVINPRRRQHTLRDIHKGTNDKSRPYRKQLSLFVLVLSHLNFMIILRSFINTNDLQRHFFREI
jgi:hypothetical protein